MTIKTLNNFGKLYYYTKDYSKAEQVLNFALNTSEKEVGKDHPITKRISRDLAEISKEKEAHLEKELIDDNEVLAKKDLALDKKSMEKYQNDAPNENEKPPVQAHQKVTPIQETIVKEENEVNELYFDVTPDIEVKETESTREKFSYPYSLLLGSFKTFKFAERAVKIYMRKGVSAYWSKVNLGEIGTWRRLFVGQFPNKEEAERFRQKHGLKEAKIKKTKYANLIHVCKSAEELDAEAYKLKEMGYSPYYIRNSEGKAYLYIGAFVTRKHAEEQFTELKSKGIEKSDYRTLIFGRKNPFFTYLSDPSSPRCCKVDAYCLRCPLSLFLSKLLE